MLLVVLPVPHGPATAQDLAPQAHASASALDLAEMASRLSDVREHLFAMTTALLRVPGEFSKASILLGQEVGERGILSVCLLIAALLFLGHGSERLFWRATHRARAWIVHHPRTTVAGRLRMVGIRISFGLTRVAIFALGSTGALLLLDWPPLLRQVLIAGLLALVVFRLTLILVRAVLAPGRREPDNADLYRFVPWSVEEARFWHRRIAVFSGGLSFGWAAVGLLGVFGFAQDQKAAAVYILGLVLLGISLEAVWRRPIGRGADPRPHLSRPWLNVLFTGLGVLLWLLWVAGLTRVFWLSVVILALPKAVALGQTAVSHLLRSHGPVPETGSRTWEVTVEHGLRTVMIVAAALFLADIWDIDLVAITARDTLPTRLVRGVLTSIVVLLLADFVWQVCKAAVDRKLAAVPASSEPGTDEAVHQARLRTLLPILRNMLFVVIVVLAGLTALSALGVEIGPLIAGAGVFGVAVGFGAQTLVKDVISGIFYLLDDAFRVGEYIQSGSYKGTVESFSLRSIKLRHHRGPVFTVPFGELGAVQNMSRDWVIDKFVLGVTYDTDLEKARKLIKRIGQELAEDPEHARHIIDPLKMQGVEQFGDYAIQIRMKMTTRPGEQFEIRRKALARIKEAFDENGIRFGAPTVKVAEAGDAGPAAAGHVAGTLGPGKATAA